MTSKSIPRLTISASRAAAWDAKLAVRAEIAERIISRQGATNAMVHHGQARVCERSPDDAPRTINRRLRVAAGESRKAAGGSGFLGLSWAG